MAAMYDALFGHFEEEQKAAEEQEARRREKEAGEAFDNMMGSPEIFLNKIINGIWR